MKYRFKIPPYLKNRYALSGIVFLIWVGFFDQNNMITQFQYHHELNKLEEEKSFYRNELKQVQADLKELKSNPASLEKFAREKYFMKKEDEEIFVIVEKE